MSGSGPVVGVGTRLCASGPQLLEFPESRGVESQSGHSLDGTGLEGVSPVLGTESPEGRPATAAKPSEKPQTPHNSNPNQTGVIRDFVSDFGAASATAGAAETAQPGGLGLSGFGIDDDDGGEGSVDDDEQLARDVDRMNAEEEAKKKEAEETDAAIADAVQKDNPGATSTENDEMIARTLAGDDSPVKGSGSAVPRPTFAYSLNKFKQKSKLSKGKKSLKEFATEATRAFEYTVKETIVFVNARGRTLQKIVTEYNSVEYTIVIGSGNLSEKTAKQFSKTYKDRSLRTAESDSVWPELEESHLQNADAMKTVIQDKAGFVLDWSTVKAIGTVYENNKPDTPGYIDPGTRFSGYRETTDSLTGTNKGVIVELTFSRQDARFDGFSENIKDDILTIRGRQWCLAGVVCNRKLNVEGARFTHFVTFVRGTIRNDGRGNVTGSDWYYYDNEWEYKNVPREQKDYLHEQLERVFGIKNPVVRGSVIDKTEFSRITARCVHFDLAELNTIRGNANMWSLKNLLKMEGDPKVEGTEERRPVALLYVPVPKPRTVNTYTPIAEIAGNADSRCWLASTLLLAHRAGVKDAEDRLVSEAAMFTTQYEMFLANHNDHNNTTLYQTAHRESGGPPVPNSNTFSRNEDITYALKSLEKASK